MTGLGGQHALVTGGNRGIGAAIAQLLSKDGADVTLLVRNRQSGEALQGELAGRSQVVTADVTDAHGVNEACREAVARFGAVQMLVNNAGSVESAPFLRTDDALFQRMLAVHLYGPLHCTRALLPDMLARQYGRIVNIASIAGVAGAPYITAYAAAKHALVGLTRSLAREVIGRGVTVNAVCPGYTETDLVLAGLENIAARTGRSPAEAQVAMLVHSPLQRFITPKEVATAVRWLCDAGASATTGQAVIVDGGELA